MKVAIITLGCKTNEYESTKIGQSLAKAGYEVVFKIEFADYYIINTCSVTQNADAKSRQLIARILAKNKNAKIVVCGCSSENSKEFFQNNKNVCAIFGTRDKEKVTSVFKQLLPQTSFATHKTRKLVKIGDGCNNFCTYCIIPHLRGRATSREINEIVCEIESGTEKEVVLTAINLFNFKPGLTQLFKKIAHINKRIRLGSIEPQMITEEFLTEFKNLKKPCPHFHLSVQSGCTKTLKAMNRHYNSMQVINAVSLIRKHFENPFIACDVIVGFPEESDSDFKESFKTMQKCEFSYMHIFPFSLRKGTAAEKLTPVAAASIKERAQQMAKLNKEMSQKFLTSQIGKTEELLIETKKEGLMTGHTKNFVKCYINKGKSGEVLNVRFDKLFESGILVDKI